MAFNAAGTRVAIETRWVDEGPGFPNTRIELRDVATGAVVDVWSARLTEAEASGGFPASSAAARTQAAGALSSAGIDLTATATAFPCSDGRCGPTDAAGSGCLRRRDTVRVTVTSTPTERKADQCYGRGTPDLLTLSVQGRAWTVEADPADGCPADYRATTAWLQGPSAVILLTHTIPGHEGRVLRPLTLTGRIR